MRDDNFLVRFDGCILWRGDFRHRDFVLFFGQRMAKDYAGAAVLVPYFLLALAAIYLLAQR